jgi:hypothetical protein
MSHFSNQRPQPGPAQLVRNAGPEEWLEQAKLCRYLPEADMKRLCEIVKEYLMEGKQADGRKLSALFLLKKKFFFCAHLLDARSLLFFSFFFFLLLVILDFFFHRFWSSFNDKILHKCGGEKKEEERKEAFSVEKLRRRANR